MSTQCSILPNAESPIRRILRPGTGERGNQVSGANPATIEGRGRDLLSIRARPTANPAGSQEEKEITEVDNIPSHRLPLAALIVGVLVALGLAAGAGQASASGKTVDCGPTASGGLNASTGKCFEFKRARLIKGKAVAPASAPPKVKRVIARANEISDLPYNWGGGRATWPNIDPSGYDCSGSVSYALRGLGAKYLPTPLVSGSFAQWGKRGKGKWITVYANGGHVYMVVAGLRFDTSMTPGNGPGWSKSMRSTFGTFAVRSPRGY